MAPALGYWNIRGLAEQIRLLLRYLKVVYEEKIYKPGPAPDYDHREWLADKFNLCFSFPNMPYYIDGDFKISQSSAILEYIAEKHDMVPDCKKQRAILHMLMNDITDFRIFLAMVCYSPDYETLKVNFLKTLPDMRITWEIRNGSLIHYPDFSLRDLLNVLEKFESTCLNDFPKLKTYLRNFENLPELKDYMASQQFKTRNYFYVVAKWR